jgi:endonuclease/exonuclease/phosphatase family metal-dependent hydrolase
MKNFRHPIPLAALLSAFILGESFTFAAEEKTGTDSFVELKVLTYNIHHGRGADGKIDLARIAEIIMKSGADLVALQEVDRKTKRSKGIDQAAELGKLTGMHAVFGKAIAFSGGEYGDAILSRFPIVTSRVLPLPTDPAKEDRAAVLVEVEANGKPVSFVATHLSHERESSGERKKAFATIREAVRKSSGAANAILAGDLNAGPESEEIIGLREHWVLTGDKTNRPTWPADKPRIRIDYIALAKGSKFMPSDLQVIDEAVASDHRPVLATFEIPGNRTS